MRRVSKDEGSCLGLVIGLMVRDGALHLLTMRVDIYSRMVSSENRFPVFRTMR